MNEWELIQIPGIAAIEERVAEFQVWELNKTPYGKFKVKILKRARGSYSGYTNIMVKNAVGGDAECGVGHGNSIAEALEDTIRNLLELLSYKEQFTEDDFEWSDPDDF